MAKRQAAEITKYLNVARRCLVSLRYDEALAHFICLCNIQPSLKTDIEDDFMIALCQCVELLEQRQEYRKIVVCFQEAAILFPNNEALLNNIGGTLFRLGFQDEAASFFRQALQVNPDNIHAKQCLENISNTLVERWHFRMLNDKGRNTAYKQAITKAVASGYDIVLDIGSGSGILSMFAVQAGARKVYACELSKTLFEVSQDVLKANNMRDSVHVINKKSTDMIVGNDIPSQVSLVVTETMDCGLLGEGILKTISHAWKYLLRPASNKAVSKVIPCGAKLYGMAITAPDIRNQCRSKLVIAGINMSSVNIIGGDQLDPEGDHDGLVVDPIEPYTTESLSLLHHGYTPLSQPFVIAEYDFCDPASLSKSRRPHFDIPVTCTGSLDAIAVWFDVQLDDDISISTGPSDSSLCWEQAVFPVFPHHLKNAPLNTVNDEVLIQVHHGDTMVINGIIDQEFLKVQCSEICCNSTKIQCELQGETSQLSSSISDIPVSNGEETSFTLKTVSSGTQSSTVSIDVSSGIESSDHYMQVSCSSTYIASSTNGDFLQCKDSLITSQCNRDGMKTSCIAARRKRCQAVIPHPYMSRANDTHYVSAYCKVIASTIDTLHNSSDKCCRVIEHTLGLPLVSLTAAMSNETSTLITNPVIGQELLEQIRQDNNILPTMHYGPAKLEDIAQGGRCWDVFVIDLIEPSGLLRHQGLEDIVFTRGCLINKHGFIIPAEIHASAMCIESDDLISLSKVQNNENTLGLNIDSCMNQFKVSTQINIDMTTLRFKPLTEYFTLFTVDFMSEFESDESLLALLEHTNEIRVKVLRRGVIHGLPYWFNVGLDTTTSFSTYSCGYPGSHWKQAVYILDKGLQVEQGDEIIVTAVVKQSCISMQVKKV